MTDGGSLSGFVYVDANSDGEVQVTESVVSGSVVKLTGTDINGHSVSQSAVTDSNGMYLFDNRAPGTYTVTETDGGTYTEIRTRSAHSAALNRPTSFTGIVVGSGDTGTDYNFGQQQAAASTFTANQTATVAFWSSHQGQNLIKALNGSSHATALSAWLASNFSNIYGSHAGHNNLNGDTNSEVASFFKSLASSKSTKLDAEVMALALAVYVTDIDLAGTIAASYGFAVSSGGLGAATANVGNDGAAFDVDNNAVLSIMDLLYRTNQQASNGVLWDINGNHSLSRTENMLRNLAYDLFHTINNT